MVTWDYIGLSSKVSANCSHLFSFIFRPYSTCPHVPLSYQFHPLYWVHTKFHAWTQIPVKFSVSQFSSMLSLIDPPEVPWGWERNDADDIWPAHGISENESARTNSATLLWPYQDVHKQGKTSAGYIFMEEPNREKLGSSSFHCRLLSCVWVPRNIAITKSVHWFTRTLVLR